MNNKLYIYIQYYIHIIYILRNRHYDFSGTYDSLMKKCFEWKLISLQSTTNCNVKDFQEVDFSIESQGHLGFFMTFVFLASYRYKWC